MTDGIYTLANDRVYDQLVALLNSIEINAGADYPVAVIAYDDQLERTRAELAKRPNATLIDDPTLLAPWETFTKRVWATHPTALEQWRSRGETGIYRLNCNHRYAAFDPAAPFNRFIYLDADTLVLGNLQPFFDALDHSDVAVYDFQFKDPSHIFNVRSPLLSQRFSETRLQTEIFCSGCFASKRGLFTPNEQDWLIEQLAQGDADLLYPFAPNQSVLNYMVMRTEKSVCNLALHLPIEQRTGNAVTSTHFEYRDRLLYDHNKRLTYLHYIGIPSKAFQQLCQGENLEIPYRECFVDYRYWHDPDQRPTFTGHPRPYNAAPPLLQRILRKAGFNPNRNPVTP